MTNKVRYRYKGDVIRLSTGLKEPFEDYTYANNKTHAMNNLLSRHPDLDLLWQNLSEYPIPHQEDDIPDYSDEDTHWGYDTCPHCHSRLDQEMLCPKCDLGEL